MRFFLQICIVFFIVLDFKVNKGWSTAVLLFLCPYANKPPRRLILLSRPSLPAQLPRATTFS